MKKILLMTIMFMLFMGVVSAANKNGSYKGNPIVKLFNDGIEVVADDAPAMVYDNRTMIPIYLLRKIGANVTWDQDKYSIDVKIPNAQLIKKVISSTSVLGCKNIGFDLIDEKVFSTCNYDEIKGLDINKLNTFDDFNDIWEIGRGLSELGLEYINIDYFSKGIKIGSLSTYSKLWDDYQYGKVTWEQAQKSWKVVGFGNLKTETTTPLPSTAPKPTPAPTIKPIGTPVPDVIYVPVDTTPTAIETKIDGDFDGWDGDTIFKLLNGQIWQQVSYAYTYHYAYSPDVLIYKDGTVYKMKVDGVDKTITVKRLK